MMTKACLLYTSDIPALKAAYAEEGFYVGVDQLDALCNIKSKNEVIADIIEMCIRDRFYPCN